MEDKDASQETLEQVRKTTEPDRAKGEEFRESRRLKRALREAKERLISELPKPSGKWSS